MNLQKFKEASAIVAKIEHLDNDIKDIEALGMRVATGETKSSFRMEILDEVKQETKATIDESGSLNYDRGGVVYPDGHPQKWLNDIWPSTIFKESQKKSKNGFELKQSLDGKATIKILGFILYEKRIEREDLIEKLNQLKPL